MPKRILVMKNNLSKTRSVSASKATDIKKDLLTAAAGRKKSGTNLTVGNGTVNTADKRLEEIEEQIMSEHNSIVDEQVDRWNKNQEQRKKDLEKLKEKMDKIDIRPTGMYILAKPFEANPFARMIKTDSGVIVPEFDNSYKSMDTGDIEEMQKFSTFAQVMEVGPMCRYVKKDDIIFYSRSSAQPIPFYGLGFELVPESAATAIINDADALEERYKILYEKFKDYGLK